MIVARFKGQCRPDCTQEVAAAIAAVETPSRELPGVVHFDVARSLTDSNAFVVAAGALTGDPEWTVWETAAIG
jgi:quinol monooxygenase YgiN